MNSFVFFGLLMIIVIKTVTNLFPNRQQPSQMPYTQVDSRDSIGDYSNLSLIFLIGVILLAIGLG